MFKFLFQILLGKTFPIPLLWSYAYPGLTGDIHLRKLRIGSPEIASVDIVEIDPRWATLFSSELFLENIDLRGVHLEMSLEEPMGLIDCLSSGDCRKVSRCSVAPASDLVPQLPQIQISKPSSNKNPINLFLQRVIIQGGNLTLCRAGVVEEIEIGELKVSGLRIPSHRNPLSLSGSARLRGQSPSEIYPIALEVQWLPEKRVLEMKARVDRFPLSVISKFFPEHVERDAQKGMVIPLQFGKQTVVQEIKKDGSITGEVFFEFFPDKPGEKQWNVRLP